MPKDNPPLRAEDFPKRFYLDSPVGLDNIRMYDHMARLRRRLEIEYSMSTITRVVKEPRECVILDIFETKVWDWNRRHETTPAKVEGDPDFEAFMAGGEE